VWGTLGNFYATNFSKRTNNLKNLKNEKLPGPRDFGYFLQTSFPKDKNLKKLKITRCAWTLGNFFATNFSKGQKLSVNPFRLLAYHRVRLYLENIVASTPKASWKDQQGR
jgi:hypothetical protein